MKQGIYITYKNGYTEILETVYIDCKDITIKGHVAKMIDAWKQVSGVYKIDDYNAVLLDEVICIRAIS